MKAATIKKGCSVKWLCQVNSCETLNISKRVDGPESTKGNALVDELAQGAVVAASRLLISSLLVQKLVRTTRVIAPPVALTFFDDTRFLVLTKKYRTLSWLEPLCQMDRFWKCSARH